MLRQSIIPLLAALLLCGCTGKSSYRMNAFSHIPENLASVFIDSTTVDGLIVYYPQFSRIDLVCGTMPDQQDTNVVFCAEAAFTHELLDTFAHTNIDGDHVSGGKRYKGAECKDNSGAFAWFDETMWVFVNGEYDELLDSVAAAGGMGFGQAIIIHNGESIRPLWRDNLGKNTVTHYRALCEKDGQLCIADSRDEVEYATFVALLEDFEATHALYLDMGAGWNHSWWRDKDGKVHEIHPVADKSRYCTNWITFYK
jgi:hypothetical protein